MSKPTVSAFRSVRSRSLSNSQARSPSPHQGRSRAHRSAPCGRCPPRNSSARWRSRRCSAGWSKLASTASLIRAVSSMSAPPASSASQSIRNWRLTGLSSSWSGLRPDGLAGPEHVVAAADRADEELGAAVLVEEDDSRMIFARLGEQEVQHHRLARARRADDGEIAEVALVEVEIIGAGGGGLEQRDRLAPMVHVGLAEREIVARGQPREIARRDQAAPGDIFEIARELRPEGGLEPDLLAHRDDAEIGERRLHLGDPLVDGGRRVGAQRDGHVMLAEAGAAGGDLVLGAGEVGAQADRLVLGRAHPAQREVHPRQRRLAVDEAEALRDGELEGQPQQFVEHAGRGLAGIILDRDEAGEAARARPGRAELHRLLAEAHPPIGQIGAEILHRQQHRAHLAIVERGEEFERLRADAGRRVVDAEQPRPVIAERRDQRLARDVELARLVDAHWRRPRRRRGRAWRAAGRSRRPGPGAAGESGSGTAR